MVRGFVNAQIESLSGLGPHGSLEISLGNAWTPDVPGVGPIRPYVAMGPLSSGGPVDPRDYVFRARSSEGGYSEFVP